MTSDIDTIQAGWDTFTVDGEKLGSVSDTASDFVVVSKGLLLPTDYYVPLSAVREVRADEAAVVLGVTKDEFDRQGWDQPMDAADIDRSGNGHASGYAGTTAGEVESEDVRRVPRYEEDLRAEKTTANAGEVRVTKDVVEEPAELEVPVAREDVEVRRTAVDRPAGQDADAFSEGEVARVPVSEEQVQVTKEPRVVEEYEVRKTEEQGTAHVSDNVRKERINVEDTTRGGRDMPRS